MIHIIAHIPPPAMTISHCAATQISPQRTGPRSIPTAAQEWFAYSRFSAYSGYDQPATTYDERGRALRKSDMKRRRMGMWIAMKSSGRVAAGG